MIATILRIARCGRSPFAWSLGLACCLSCTGISLNDRQVQDIFDTSQWMRNYCEKAKLQMKRHLAGEYRSNHRFPILAINDPSYPMSIYPLYLDGPTKHFQKMETIVRAGTPYKDDLDDWLKQTLLKNGIPYPDSLSIETLTNNIRLTPTDSVNLMNNYAAFENRFGENQPPSQILDKLNLLIQRKDMPVFLFIHLIESSKFEAIQWLESQLDFYGSTFDAFGIPFPFLVIPSAMKLPVKQGAQVYRDKVDIYYFDRNDHYNGLYITSVKINDKAVPYNPFKAHDFLVPVKKQDEEIQRIKITVDALSTSGYDTTFYIEKEFKVLGACSN